MLEVPPKHKDISRTILSLLMTLVSHSLMSLIVYIYNDWLTSKLGNSFLVQNALTETGFMNIFERVIYDLAGVFLNNGTDLAAEKHCLPRDLLISDFANIYMVRFNILFSPK